MIRTSVLCVTTFVCLFHSNFSFPGKETKLFHRKYYRVRMIHFAVIFLDTFIIRRKSSIRSSSLRKIIIILLRGVILYYFFPKKIKVCVSSSQSTSSSSSFYYSTHTHHTCPRLAATLTGLYILSLTHLVTNTNCTLRA